MTAKLLLFDLDDTLCDYAGARARRLQRAFATAFELAQSELLPDYEQMIRESIAIHPHGADHFAELLERYGVKASDAANAARRWYQTNRFYSLRLFDDAVAALTFARAVHPDRRIGLITNGPADVQRAKIELLQVEPYFDFVIISGEFGVAKPDPAIFDHALNLADAQKEETLFIGDSAEFDIAGAAGIGMRSIWINRTGQAWIHQDFSPDHEVDSLTALLPLLG